MVVFIFFAQTSDLKELIMQLISRNDVALKWVNCIVISGTEFFVGSGLGKDGSGRANAVKVGVKNNMLGVCMHNVFGDFKRI